MYKWEDSQTNKCFKTAKKSENFESFLETVWGEVFGKPAG